MIYIGKEMYVGRKLQGEHKSPLGFATYMEDNKAFEKRKSTIDNWASSWRNKDDNLNPLALKNRLISGFRITDDVKRIGYGGGNVVWRIRDPRGFELEIQSANMASIMADCVIDHGEIMTPCVWAWNKSGGSRLVLLPEGSEPYVEAMKETERANKTTSLKDVNIGDVVVLKNGNEGTYMGRFHTLMNDYERHETGKEYPWYTQNRSQGIGFKVVLRSVLRITNDKGKDCFMFVSKPNISSIVKQSEKEISREDSAKEINDALFNGAIRGDGFMDVNYNYHRRDFICVFADKVTTSDFSLTMSEETYNPKDFLGKTYGDGTPDYLVGYEGDTLKILDLVQMEYAYKDWGYKQMLRTAHMDSWENNMISMIDLPRRMCYNQSDHSSVDWDKVNNIEWKTVCIKYKDDLLPMNT
jgi:hypothetical protein